MLIRRPKQRKPEPVANSWKRLEAWFERNLPEVMESLRPGCSLQKLQAFEKEAGFILPDSVKESFQIHDGQIEYPNPHAHDPESECLFEYPGAIAGLVLDSLEEMSRSLSSWRQRYNDEQSSDQDLGLSDRCTSYPPDAIRCQWANPNWVPIGDRDGNCYGIDLDPGPNGVNGQVIHFGKDEENKYVLALSWDQFLQDIADELEAGHIVATHGEFGEVEFFGRPNCDDHDLSHFYKQWARAKLPTAFQKVKPCPKEPIATGQAIGGEIAEQARSLVLRFIEAMHAHEMKWLEVRPIHELGYSRVSEGPSGYGSSSLAGARRRAPWEEMALHVHAAAAIQEKKALLQQFVTPKKRLDQDTFVQVYPPANDPNRDRIAEVRQLAPDDLIVYLLPVDGVTTRFHLKSVRRKWLIDFKDVSTDGVTFKKTSL